MPEIRVELFKAIAIADREIPNLLVVATQPVPESPMDSVPPHYRSPYFKSDAVKLLDALGKVLPQGTRDALFAEMAARLASSFKVL